MLRFSISRSSKQSSCPAPTPETGSTGLLSPRATRDCLAITHVGCPGPVSAAARVQMYVAEQMLAWSPAGGLCSGTALRTLDRSLFLETAARAESKHRAGNSLWAGNCSFHRTRGRRRGAGQGWGHQKSCVGEPRSGRTEGALNWGQVPNIWQVKMESPGVKMAQGLLPHPCASFPHEHKPTSPLHAELQPKPACGQCKAPTGRRFLEPRPPVEALGETPALLRNHRVCGRLPCWARPSRSQRNSPRQLPAQETRSAFMRQPGCFIATRLRAFFFFNQPLPPHPWCSPRLTLSLCELNLPPNSSPPFKPLSQAPTLRPMRSGSPPAPKEKRRAGGEAASSQVYHPACQMPLPVSSCQSSPRQASSHSRRLLWILALKRKPQQGQPREGKWGKRHKASEAVPEQCLALAKAPPIFQAGDLPPSANQHILSSLPQCWEV